MTNYLCDLHCHTNRSDGSDSPLELIQNAAKQGMKIIAITDHETVPPKTVIADGQELDIEAFAAKLGIKLVLGTEISCDTLVDDVHILGYGCNWEAPFFGRIAEQVQKAKLIGYQEFVARLNKLDFPLSWEEVVRYSKNGLQKKYIFELLAQKGYFKTWQEAKIWANGNPALENRREKPEPKDVICEIHNSGGIAVLAHPYLINEPVQHNGGLITRHAYIEELIGAGLDGIEATYTYDKTSYRGNLTREEIAHDVTEKYAHGVRIVTGGSDYHAEHKKGIKNTRQIGECGIDPAYFYSNPLLGKL